MMTANACSRTLAQRLKCLLILLMLTGVVERLDAQSIDPKNLIVENVNIAAADAEDATVNLLIRDNKLSIATKDLIPIPDGIVALDANGGYLVGNLVIGESPSFIILDGDPRIDFEILLNIEYHSVFVLHDGEVRKNTLKYAADMFEAQAEQKGWHAYMPPPVALPTNYGYTGKWNHWATKNTTGAFFGVMALDRQFWPYQNEDSHQQVDSLSEYEGGAIRDLRFGIYGTLDFFEKPWGYYLAISTNAFDKAFETEGQESFRFFDYRLDIPMPNDLRLSVGKQKAPISMERLMTLIDVPIQERSSVTNALLPGRNFGALISGNALGKRMSWAAGVFNEFIDTGQSIGEAETSLVGRITYLPYLAEDESNLLHVGSSIKLSNGDDGYQYQSKPEFNKSPLFVDTGVGLADGIRQYNLEASWRRGPFWLGAEYVHADVDSPTEGNLSFEGYALTASWIISGEMRAYRYRSGTFGPVPVSRSVYQNGRGAWEVAGRWSRIDLTDRGVNGGEMNILSVGLNWWLSDIFMLNFDYRYIVNDRAGLNGRAAGATIRLLLKLT